MHAHRYRRPHAVAVAILLLAMVVLGTAARIPPAPAHATVQAAEPGATPAPTVRPGGPAERTAQDKLTAAAAIGSIVVVAVAGTYIYVLIRRGL